ncbi:MAG: Tol-Pal system beta propeller repeat protein TolB, partial [Gammaproteobacteria bacterium]|nr:Tol-Pal system beta propeller repeat protein TolB [Gammaproteobacteria bacterium]
MINVRKILYLLCFFTLVFVPPVQAVLNLELTQGVDNAVPIAVIPFVVTGEKPSADVSNIITQDLQNSGQFKLMDTSAVKLLPSQPKGVDFQYWRSVDVNDVVIGSVKPLGNQRFSVTYFLLDPYKTGNEIISTQSVTVKEAQLRVLAHHIADAIYQQITGVPGIFATKIAYVLVQRQGIWPIRDTYRLVVADADGYNPQAILISRDPIMSPSWSPDGKRLAYVSFEKRRASVYISNVATGVRTLVTQFPEINGAPAWSKDGKRLAIVLSKDGNPRIYSIDLATKKIVPITRSWSIDTEPAWSPDGKTMLFTSDRGGSPQIYLKDLNSGKVQRITFDGSYNAKASWAPDGKSIVFLHRNQQRAYDIAMQDLQTGNVTVL